MINDAKKALAGLEVMMAIIEIVSARRPDLVEQAAEQVLGVKTDLSDDDEFKAILDKRAEAVTHFDQYPDRVGELEHAVTNIKHLVIKGRYSELVPYCDEVLK